MTTFYIIDTRSNVIVNAVESHDREAAERTLRLMIDGDHLRLDPNPPLTLLQRYRYWNERP